MSSDSDHSRTYARKTTKKLLIKGIGSCNVLMSKRPKTKHPRIVGLTRYVRITIHKLKKICPKATKVYLAGYHEERRFYIRQQRAQSHSVQACAIPKGTFNDR